MYLSLLSCGLHDIRCLKVEIFDENLKKQNKGVVCFTRHVSLVAWIEAVAEMLEWTCKKLLKIIIWNLWLTFHALQNIFKVAQIAMSFNDFFLQFIQLFSAHYLPRFYWRLPIESWEFYLSIAMVDQCSEKKWFEYKKKKLRL